MELEYKQANPQSGNVSYLIRFKDIKQMSHNPCLLIDSGDGVAIDSLLDENDYLVGILLTHAHTDHYLTLANNIRDSAKVYTSPATADVLKPTLREGKEFNDLGNIEKLLQEVEPIMDWETLLDIIRVRPIPAGHIPGASGFLVQFDDGNEKHNILITGDFTTTRSAGYSELDSEWLPDIDSVFLTGTISENDERNQLLENAVERSLSGSRVLVTSTGITSVEYAYILGHLADRLSPNLDIKIVGQAAKLYEALNYNVPNVTSIPVFEDPTDYFPKESIVIAGPEVPESGASKAFFDLIKSDPMDVLLQSHTGFSHPIDSATCTVIDYEYKPHPSQKQIDELVGALDPISVILVHQMGRAADRYKNKYQSFVWATDQRDWYEFYDNGEWLAPPWLNIETEERIRSNTDLVESGDGEDIPPLSRIPTPDLDEEGVELRRFEKWEPREAERSESGDFDFLESDQQTPTDSHNSTNGSVIPDYDIVDLNKGTTPPVDQKRTPVGNTIGGVVIDNNEGSVLLRLPVDNSLEDYEHGDEVTVTIR